MYLHGTATESEAPVAVQTEQQARCLMLTEADASGVIIYYSRDPKRTGSRSSHPGHHDSGDLVVDAVQHGGVIARHVVQVPARPGVLLPLSRGHLTPRMPQARKAAP